MLGLSYQTKQELAELTLLSGGVITVATLGADFIRNVILNPNPANQTWAAHSPALIAVIPAIAAIASAVYLVRSSR